VRLPSLLLASAALAAVSLAPPLAAQDSFTYQDIPWGISAQAATDALAARGFVLNTEFTPDEGELMYEDDDDVVALASFAGDALVGIRIAYAATADQVEDLFEQTVTEGTQNLGDPDSSEDDVVTWRLGETSFSVMMGQSDHDLPYIVVQYTGPGYEEEIARRVAATNPPRPLPALDARWTVLAESEAQRVAFDRTTLRPMVGRVVRAWVRNDYGSPQTDESGTYDRTMDQMDYDCEQLRFRHVASTYHLDEQVVDSELPSEPGEWVSIVPESMGETVINAVCAVRR
jgi:hypothetical protein